MSATRVEIWVDPRCPWAWLTSRWLLEAAAVRDFDVVTRVFSLHEVNRGADAAPDPEHVDNQPLRAMVAARRRGGEQAIRALYTELGEARHERGEPLTELETIRAAARAANLPEGLVDAAISDSGIIEEVLREHTEAVGRGAFGVPTLSVDGKAVAFGPIVDHRVTGEAAGELWDKLLSLLCGDVLLEIKRDRPRAPQVGRHRADHAA